MEKDYEEFYIEIIYPGNNLSESHFRDFFGRVVKDENGLPLNGTVQIGEYPYAIIRFHKGMIDGNLYDDKGNILNRYPAIEYYYNYESYQEFWTQGYPDGLNAIIVGDGKDYEEYWCNKELLRIKKKDWWPALIDSQDREEIQFTYEYIFTKTDSLIYDNQFFVKPNFDTEIIEKIDDILSLYENDSFQDRLLKIMRTKKLSDPEVYRRIGMDEKIFNKVKNAKPDASISYDNAVMIAFGLKLTFKQMVKFVNFAGKGFRNYSERDKIVREFIEAENYDVRALNEKLLEKNLKLFLTIKNKNKTSSKKKSQVKQK